MPHADAEEHSAGAGQLEQELMLGAQPHLIQCHRGVEAWTLLKACFIGGLVLVLIGTGANVLLALIYNLTSDVVGGVEVTVLAEDTGRRRQVV